MYSQAIANVSAAAFAGASPQTPRRALSPRATIVQTTFTPFVAVTRIGDGASPRASRARVVETTGRNTDDDLPSRLDAQPPPPRPARRLPRAPPRSASPPLSEDLRKSVGTSGRSPETSGSFYHLVVSFARRRRLLRIVAVPSNVSSSRRLVAATFADVPVVFFPPRARNRPLRRVATRAVAEPAVEAADSARPVYPFSAIIGQEEMKFAAIMNIIDPNIGGIMVMGDRGTGKSTTVRALVDLLPLIDIVKDDAFMSSPTDPNLMAPEVLAKYKAGEALETTKVPINMVDLPLGATEDRVCGTIDIEKALTEGTKAFEPGSRQGEPRHPVRRRGEPPGRPPRGRAPGFRRVRLEHRRARGHLHLPPRPLHPDRLRQPRGGRAPPPAARPLRHARADQNREAARGAREGCRGAHRVRLGPQDVPLEVRAGAGRHHRAAHRRARAPSPGGGAHGDPPEDLAGVRRARRRRPPRRSS